MRPSRTIDISTGLFVMLGFAAILFLGTQITNRECSLRDDSFRLNAAFGNIGGLKSGAPVSLAGATGMGATNVGFSSTPSGTASLP